LLASSSLSCKLVSSGIGVSRLVDSLSIEGTGEFGVGVLMLSKLVNDIPLSGEPVEEAALDLGGVDDGEVVTFGGKDRTSKRVPSFEVLKVATIPSAPASRKGSCVTEINA
jgi:hypothetical protein